MLHIHQPGKLANIGVEMSGPQGKLCEQEWVRKGYNLDDSVGPLWGS